MNKLPWSFRVRQAWRLLVHGRDDRYDELLACTFPASITGPLTERERTAQWMALAARATVNFVAITMDTPSQRWIAPEIWEEMLVLRAEFLRLARGQRKTDE